MQGYRQRLLEVRHAVQSRDRDSVVYAYRRDKLRRDLRRIAAKQDAHVTLDMDISVRLEGEVQVEVHEGARASIVIEADVALGDRIQIQVQDGGRLRIERGTYIRRDCVLVVGGELTVGPYCVISWSCYLLCNERLHLEEGVGFAQGVTAVDSRHYAVGDSNYWRDNIETEPVHIGHDSYIGAGALLLPSSDLAPRTIVAGNAVVSGSFPKKGLILGIPGRWREIPAHLQREVDSAES